MGLSLIRGHNHMERAEEAAFVEEVRRIALAVLPRTMDRAPGCQAVIGERGMRTQRTEELALESFAFVVEPRGAGGWQAVSIRGTIWSETGVGCGAVGCRTRVDASGVTLL